MQKANKNEVRKEIADLINRIKEQSDRIGMQREIPQSELDLILHRIEELHRRTVVWSYLNELPEESSQLTVSGSQLEVDSSQLTVSGSENVSGSGLTDPEIPSTQRSSDVTKIEKETIIEESVPNQQPETTIIPAETNTARVETVPVQPVIRNLKDIRSFIGFNEKLMYIRQVFGGDNAAYDEALNQINAMQSMDEAEAYISVLAGEYKWNKEHEPVAIFMQTVKRRFS